MMIDPSIGPARVFVSYSRDDRQYRDALSQHLAHLVDSGLLEIWHDAMIEPGENWEDQITECLEDADVILLLVSPAFNASRYIHGKELSRAMERHKAEKALLVPIFVRPVGAIELLPFAYIQALPVDGRLMPVSQWANQDAAWAQVADKLRVLADKLRARPAEAGSSGVLASALLAESFAMLHVDLMRLVVVLFDSTVRAQNHHRLSEFFDVADEQIDALDLQLTGSGRAVPEPTLREAGSLRRNLVRTLQALKHAERNIGVQSIVKNLHDVGERIDALLRHSTPSQHRDSVSAVRTALDGVPAVDGSRIEQIARRRLRAQSNLLRSSPLRSIAEDFDQTLALPYFLIDLFLLRESAA
jgi:hypothetical protein